MGKSEMIKWLQNLKKDIGQSQHRNLWHYAEVLDEVMGAIEVSNKAECDNCIWDICNYNKIDWEVGEDCISRANAIEVVGHFLDDLNVALFGLSGEALAKRFLDNCPTVAPANPCEDCISRTDLLNTINAYMTGSQQVEHMKGIIKNAPSVIPQVPSSDKERKVDLSYVEWLEQVVAEYQPDWICDELVSEDNWCYDRCKSNWDKECLMRYYNKHFREVEE